MRREIQPIDGSSVPRIGFGTYRMTGQECVNAVTVAIEAGYRHVDTAIAYENESAVGRGLAEASVERDDVYLTSKVKGYKDQLRFDGLVSAVESSLERLDTGYLDLLLIHWWNPDVDLEEPISAINHLQDRGLVRNIGVSNFSVEQLEAAMQVSKTPILTNQVEYHPYFDQGELLDFCQANDVILTAYSPLGAGRVVDDEILASIGDRYGKSAAQTALRWLLEQENVVAIPKASSRSKIEQNFQVWDFELTDAEVQKIDDLDGPFLYRLNSEGGAIYRVRRRVGPIYSSVRSILTP